MVSVLKSDLGGCLGGGDVQATLPWELGTVFTKKGSTCAGMLP